MNKKVKNFFEIFCLITLLLICITVSVFTGSEKISLSDLLNREEFSFLILKNFRIPRTVLSCLAGALLAGAGCVFQSYFRNPLADSGIMGMTSGASLGAVCGISFFSGFLSNKFGITYFSLLNAGAFIGALTAGFIVSSLSVFWKKSNSTVVLLLCGTALSSLYSALTSLLLIVNEKNLHGMFAWMMGSFNGRGWMEVKMILVPALISFVMFVFLCRPLELLSGGEESAMSLGLNVSLVRSLVLISGSFATCAAVCAGGTIGFVGLIAPFIIRGIFGHKLYKVLPLSMLAGAVLVCSSDIICRLIIRPAELPVGIVMSILGVPFFIALLMNSRKL